MNSILNLDLKNEKMDFEKRKTESKEKKPTFSEPWIIKDIETFSFLSLIDLIVIRI